MGISVVLWQMLRRILFAYSIRNHSVGYCQGMNYICAHILKHVGNEEDAFWLLARIIEDYMPGYFTADMIESQVDQLVFKSLVEECLPALGKHFEDVGLHIPCVTSRWFICLYVGCVPILTVNQLWDGFVEHGTIFLMQVSYHL